MKKNNKKSYLALIDEGEGGGLEPSLELSRDSWRFFSGKAGGTFEPEGASPLPLSSTLAQV